MTKHIFYEGGRGGYMTSFVKSHLLIKLWCIDCIPSHHLWASLQWRSWGLPLLHNINALYCITRTLAQVYYCCHTLHYTATHYTALHYTTLHCTTLHCTSLNYTTLQRTVLHCTTMHYTALKYTTLHTKELYCTALNCAAIMCTAIQGTALPCKLMHCCALFSNIVHCTDCTPIHCNAR